MLKARRVALCPQLAKPLDVLVGLNRFADIFDVLAAFGAVCVGRVPRVQRTLSTSEFRCVGVEPVTIGLDVVEWCDLTDFRGVSCRLERRFRRAMARLAVLPIDRLAACDTILTDSAGRERGRLRGFPEPVGDT